MSASEKLERLDGLLPRGIVPWQRYGNDISIPEVDIVRWAYADLPPGESEDADERAAAVLDPLVAIRNALPELIAVVEAAEKNERDPYGLAVEVTELGRALAALDEKLP